MIYIVVPRYGRSNPIVYISICSVVGSVSVMAIKGFGVAVKLTFAGNNQFTHPSTYVFMIVVTLSILVQMNYFNKALDTFSTNVVNPLYYVGFSTCTIVASLILFQGFNTQDASNTFSLLSGFFVTFLGVHLLNLSRTAEPPLDHANGHSALETGLMNPRLSLQGRMSLDGWNGPPDRGMDIHMGGVAGRHGRQSSLYKAQSTTLFNAFEGDEPGSARPHANGHRRQQSNGELRQVAEADEWSEDDEGSDEHTPVLRKGGLRRQQQQHANTSSIALPLSSARSHSHSPTPDAALTDVRITPR